MPETKLGESKSNIIRQVSFKHTSKLIVFPLSFRRNFTPKSVSFKVSANGILPFLQFHSFVIPKTSTDHRPIRSIHRSPSGRINPLTPSQYTTTGGRGTLSATAY
ncbi:hypothetical protein [Pig stool associated circular ssDNA virus]|nr:hypothetical protein [Pig stool associated circular ssDNA virus]